MTKKLTDEEIERELNEYYANSESEDETYDIDLAVEDSEPCFDQSRSSDDHFNLINSNNINSVYNSNQMQYSTPTEISQYDLQASGLLHNEQYLFKDVDIDEALQNLETDFQDYLSQNDSFQSPSSSITQQSRITSDVFSSSIGRPTRSSKVPKAIKTLKWKKNANSFQPKIHEFNPNNVCYCLFFLKIQKLNKNVFLLISEWCSM
ncbi:uncharacterized protein LOC126550771 [Aphis gossypii]|uniref:uncharacterized protein LOC126550771 n=1 Tax=Aphis gossypii TaxID=80765 RepID=UPI002158DCCC|nr:uncharacterized protein LOC126550771 [Aphis gossypii]